MRRAERLFRLVNEMRTRQLCRADDLARQFEISVRTVYRDIAHLQASGLPIDGAPGVGYLLRPGFNLPNVTFTHDQIEALAIGLSFVEQRGDPILALAAQEARAKLQASLPQPEARKLSDAPYFALPHIAKARAPQTRQLRHAIRHKQVARLIYTDGAGIPTTRHVRPLALWSLPEGWMFTGWCELRQDFRTFRLDRISHLHITDERFQETDATSLHTFLAKDQCHSSTGH